VPLPPVAEAKNATGVQQVLDVPAAKVDGPGFDHVRAGIGAVGEGQREAARALGLAEWPIMRLVVLPQALRITIPNIVNTYIGLFKDTTLVYIVGIFDFLHTIEVARIDPKWATPTTSTTGYAVAAIFYLIFCYGMSRYARAMEARLAQGRER